MTEAEKNKAFMEKARTLQVGTKTFKSHFNDALGAYVSTPSDIKNRLKEIEGETGQKLIEVGNEKASAQLGSKSNDYKFTDNEKRDMNQMLGGD